MSTTETLKQSDLFKDLLDHELARVSAALVELQCPADTVLLTQHEPVPAVFILKTGAVKVMVNGEIVARINTVQCFGEMSCVLPGTVATASVLTLGESQLLRFDKASFLQLLDEVPRLWRALFLQTSERLRTATRRQSEILQHTPQGFMKLDRAARVTNEYSMKCARYFGQDDLTGVSFAGLVCQDDPQGQAFWIETYGMLFEDSFMAFDDLTGLLTQELRLPSAEGDHEYVFSYHASRNADGGVAAVDVGVEDVTAQRKLERANVALRREQGILGKIHGNPEVFFKAVALLEACLTTVSALGPTLVATPPVTLAPRMEAAMRQLHSVKGLAGMFALSEVQDSAHALESAIRAFATGGATTPAEYAEFSLRLDALSEAHGAVQRRIDTMGSGLRQRLTGTVLSGGDVDRLRTAIALGDLAGASRIMDALDGVEASRLFASWDAEVSRLAQAMGKEARFALAGEGAKLQKPVFDALSPVVSHLMTNALSHGLELPEVRQAAGKASVGTLQVVLGVESGMLRIAVADDGRGLDFRALPAQARKKSGVDQVQVDTYEHSGQAWRILLLPGFSTAAELSLVSGRGVGLDAVEHAVRSVGGHILIDSTVGQGTTFTLLVPVVA